MKVKSLRISLVIPLLLLASSCSAGTGSSDQSAATALPVRIARADLASGGTSVEELATQSQLAVLGTARTARQEPNKVDPAIVSTVQSFTVDKIVWGTITRDAIEVRFTGGVVRDDVAGSYLLQLEGQPQFDDGHQYFLVLLGPSPDGTYMVFGGPQGRYEVTDGRLVAVEGTADDLVIASLDGAKFDAVAQELASLTR
ncbi:MAG: hypothetical protein LBL55_06000 [Propionibacteriaceae bacterium]|jgi:hypothetical protein|nr:hypothetical protein [Propionibacteriaceae bacterium]